MSARGRSTRRTLLRIAGVAGAGSLAQLAAAQHDRRGTSWAGGAPLLWLQRTPPPILNPYHEASTVPWWKGQLHMHTARSYDGEPQMTPAQRAVSYQTQGYDFAVYTDHNRVTGVHGGDEPPGTTVIESAPEARTQPILLIPGVESTDARAHLGVWLLGPEARAAMADPPQVPADQPASPRIRAWAERGALVACNHPSHPASPVSPERVESWVAGGVPVRFLEVFNSLANRTPERLEHNLEAWRRAVTAAGPEAPIWGVAADDSHGKRVGQGWVQVAAPVLTPEALRGALLAGRFYATTGPSFSRLTVDPVSGGIVAAAPDAVAIRYVGDDGAIVHQSDGEAGLWVPPSQPPSQWVRVEALDSGGRIAWSQPFWFAA